LHKIVLVVGLALILFLTLALASYSPSDAAWSTSGAGGPVHNWAGMLGAWLADLLYVLLGFSAWWCVAAAARLGRHAAALDAWAGRRGRGQAAVALGPAGLGALDVLAGAGAGAGRQLGAGVEPPVPLRRRAAGAAGGVLGYLGGPLALKWLGFTGSTLLGIAALMVGVALLFRFSWGAWPSTSARRWTR
jgi:S-DNA-T family DNA segregation ATPase FtsK/SpoIIIE